MKQVEIKPKYHTNYARQKAVRLTKAGLVNQSNRLSYRENNEVEMNKLIEVKYPFSSNMSKNVILGRGNFSKRIFMKSESRKIKEDIAFLLKAEINKQGIKFNVGKVYIDIFVQKNNPNCDALNVIDLIADAVSLGIGINDKWFCIKGIDWEFKKNDPYVFIQVIQETEEDQSMCSYCGYIGGLDMFKIERTCKQCYELSEKFR